MEANTSEKTANTPRSCDKFAVGPCASAIQNLLAYCMAWGTMGLVAGRPGVGKTVTATQFLEEYPGWIFTAHPNIATPYEALRGCARAMGVSYRLGQSGLDLWEKICQRISAQHRGILIVDEAQHLRESTLEALRSIHDETKFSIVLMGDVALLRNVMSLPQISSRIASRLQLNGPRIEDVAELTKAWNVHDRAIQKRLDKVAQTPGALRIVVQILRVALDAGEGVNQDTIEQAIAHLGVEV